MNTIINKIPTKLSKPSSIPQPYQHKPSSTIQHKAKHLSLSLNPVINNQQTHNGTRTTRTPKPTHSNNKPTLQPTTGPNRPLLHNHRLDPTDQGRKGNRRGRESH